MQQATLEDANFFAEPNFLDFETEGLTSNIAQDSNVPDLPYLGEQDARPQIQPSQYAHTSGQNVGLASVSANPGLHSRAAHASHAPQTQTPQLRSGAAQNDARPTYTGNSDQIMSTRQGNISGVNHSSNTTRVYSSRIPNHSHNNGPYTRETVHETFSPNTILESYQNNVPASAAAQTRPSFTLHQRKIPASSGTGISDSPVSSRAHFSKGLKAYRLQAALQNADLRFRQLEDQLRRQEAVVADMRNELDTQHANVISRSEFDQVVQAQRDFRIMLDELHNAVVTMNATDMPGDTA